MNSARHETALNNECSTTGPTRLCVRNATKPSPNARKKRGTGLGHTPLWKAAKSSDVPYIARATFG